MAFLTVAYAVAALIACRVIYNTYRSWQLNRLAKANGCEQPFNISYPWPLSILDGTRRVRKVINAAKTGEDILDAIVTDLFKDANTSQATGFDGSVIINTCEPANLQAMLATQFKDFEIGQLRVKQFGPVLRQSIFTSDGSFWEHSRALFRPQFSREHINDLDCTEETSKALIHAIGPVDTTSGWTQPVALQPLLFDFTLDTATAFLFGESVKSLSVTQDATTKQFKEDFELASRYMINRIRLSSLYWLADGIKFRRAISRVFAFTEQFVQRAVDCTKSPSEKKKYDLLSSLATQTQNREELRNQTMAILAAGRETTASLLGWCFLRLSLHPEIFDKLRGIVLTSFPPDQPITFETIKSCRYLQHFINEVLRLHPTVPFNNRTAAHDTTLPCGGGQDQTFPIFVRKGQIIGFSVYVMHRREDLWGPDALEFKPERWEQKERKIPAWQFLPFSGGPRICLGQQFALTETSYVIVRMLQEFDGIEPADYTEMAAMKKGLGLTMWAGSGVRVRLRRAREV